MPNYPGTRKGTRRVVVWINGRAREKIFEGTKRDADVFEAQWRIELQSSSFVPSNVRTFEQLCRAYRLYARKRLKASSWPNRKYTTGLLIEMLGPERIDRIGPLHVEQCKEILQKGREPATVNVILMALSSVLKWAREMRYPVQSFKIPKIPIRGDDRVKVFTDEEIETMFGSMRKLWPRSVPLMLFLLNTGCRRGEAIAARWSWVDLRRRIITIPATKYWSPKSGRSRDVPIADALMPILSGQRVHPEVVFPSLPGPPYKTFPEWHFAEVFEDAMVEGNIHMFRHTFAAHFLESVPDMFLLAQILGHSHTRVTELYAHLLPGRLEKARNAVNIGVPVKSVAELRRA